MDSVAVHNASLADHYLITCKITESLTSASAVKTKFRCWKRLDLDEFKQRLLNFSAFSQRAITADAFADQLRHEVCKILDELVPIREFTRCIGKLKNQWLSAEANKTKRERRRLERKWKSTGLESVRQAYRRVCKLANKLINDSRRQFYSERVTESSHDPKKLC